MTRTNTRLIFINAALLGMVISFVAGTEFEKYSKKSSDIYIQNYANCLTLANKTSLPIHQLALNDVACKTVENNILNNPSQQQRWMDLSKAFEFGKVNNELVVVTDSTELPIPQHD